MIGSEPAIRKSDSLTIHPVSSSGQDFCLFNTLFCDSLVKVAFMLHTQLHCTACLVIFTKYKHAEYVKRLNGQHWTTTRILIPIDIHLCPFCFSTSSHPDSSPEAVSRGAATGADEHGH